MDRACGTDGGEEKYIQGFCGENWGKETILKTGIDERIILKLILKEIRCEIVEWVDLAQDRDRHL